MLEENESKKQISLGLKEKRMSYFTIMVSFPLLIFGLFLIYEIIFKSNNLGIGDIIALFIIIFLFIVIPLHFLLLYIKEEISLYENDYVIIEDTLLNKHITSIPDCPDDYYFNFKNFYEKYNRTVRIDSSTYSKSNINEKFYLVFLKNIKEPKVFSQNQYILNDTDKEKIIDVDELVHFNIKIKRKHSLKNLEIIILIILAFFLIGLIIFIFNKDMTLFYIFLGMLIADLLFLLLIINNQT